MSQLNQGRRTIARPTHEGAPTRATTPSQQLRKSVLACLLWEDTFYEEGDSIADRISHGVSQVPPQEVHDLAIEARTQFRMRHAPLLLAVEMARHHNGRIVGDTICGVIQRADELTEILTLFSRDREGAKKLNRLPKQLQRGVARAFQKFDAYQLAKYNRPGPICLRDALFLVHAKPKNKDQEATWKQLVDGTLASPDTWEVGLSSGADKKETFTRLLQEKKLGYMALLRNLRNMETVGVDRELVRAAILSGAAHSKALPFRFVSAAKHAPIFEPELDTAMQASLQNLPRLKGRTSICIDCSDSMSATLSKRSELSRREAAAALAILAGGVCDSFDVFVFGDSCKQIPARANLALMDRVRKVNAGGWYDTGDPNCPYVGHGTNIGGVVEDAVATHPDRIIVVTDLQSRTPVMNPRGYRGYFINTAVYQNGVGYGPWTNIDGFSEATIRYITEIERG